MLFNSIEFALFLPVVFFLYWFIRKKGLITQNLLLLAASYIFYGWWDWRFLLLLFLLALTNYFLGIRIEKEETNKKARLWLIIGLFINIGVLVVFKYFNFFVDSFIGFFSLLGYDLPRSSIKIILPLGISFYVFLSISYIIDIYKKTLHANVNIIEVLLTFSFFPIILAGPIQRPALLLPQIAHKREFNYSQIVDGLKQILWGLFIKIVIADNLAVYVNDIFDNYNLYSGKTLLIGAILYSIQIYADFSGYSDIAIGVAKLFGFSLIRNFAYPYFSRDITEFWKRWHISLVTWFRDYLFLPLSFAISWKIRGERFLFIKTEYFIYIIASLVVWLLTGLWHGANYTFIIWGMIHGLLLIFYHLQKSQRKKLLKRIGITNNHPAIVVLESLFTLFIVMIAWIFFRSNSLQHAFSYLSGIFISSNIPKSDIIEWEKVLPIIVLTIISLLIEWHGKNQQYALANLGLKFKRPFRLAIYYLLIIAILWFGGKEQQFIYFQF